MFTEEEKVKIDETLEKIIEDLLQIREKSGIDEIFFTLRKEENQKCFYFNNKDLRINCNLIEITGCGVYYQNGRCIFSRSSDTPDKMYEIDLWTMECYPQIRKQVLENVERRMKIKKDHMDLCSQTANFIREQASVIIDLPDCLNQHTIEVEEHDGKKIGTINFGDMSIQIITSSDIELVKIEKENNKQKKI